MWMGIQWAKKKLPLLNQGEWKLYCWSKVPAHAANESVDPLPLSVTQRPVGTCWTVQPSAMSPGGGGLPGSTQELQLMMKFWVL